MNKNWIFAAFLSMSPELISTHQNQDPSPDTYKEDITSFNKADVTGNKIFGRVKQQSLQHVMKREI